MKSCPACARDLHEECNDPCCCNGAIEAGIIEAEEEQETKRRGRPRKDDNTISAGRKTAAELYPLDKESPCEWRLKRNCGGGLVPIDGCINGFQVNRHHGPVKDTKYNHRSNIHLICADCHNMWHAKNDPVYDIDKYWKLPHQPIDATIEQLIGFDDDGAL